MTPQGIAGIASAVFMTMGAIGALSVYTTFAQSRRSRAWPTVKGTITHSELTKQTEQDRSNDSSRVYETIMYGVKLGYHYVVAGKSFEASRLYWSDGIKTNVETPALAILKRYPVGHRVDVYYQPDKPDVAVLEPFTVKGIRMIAFFAAAFVVFGLVFLGVALRSQQM